jgi:pimeloyl-ACP methyl ester carboxylesterase
MRVVDVILILCLFLVSFTSTVQAQFEEISNTSISNPNSSVQNVDSTFQREAIPDGKFTAPLTSNFCENTLNANNEWTRTAKLVKPDSEWDLEYVKLFISGDTVLYSYGNSNYIYERNLGGNNQWNSIAKLTPVDQTRNVNGASIDGDTAVIRNNENDRSLGVYIFERNQGGTNAWGQFAKLIIPNGNYYLTQGIAISGDTIIVGAYGLSNSCPYANFAYIFERNQGGINNWGQVGNPIVIDDMGIDSVGISGDTVVIGCQGWDDEYDHRLEAYYVFERNQGGTNNWGQVVKLKTGQVGYASRFRTKLSISNDTIVLFRAGFATECDYENQTAFFNLRIFERNQGGTENWGFVQQMNYSTSKIFRILSYDVSVSAGVIVLGWGCCDYYSNKNFGSAFVFERNNERTGRWSQVDTLNKDHNPFSSTVSVCGDTIVAITFSEYTDTWSAYVYEKKVPILLLHGVNATPDGWDDFKTYLINNGYPSYKIDEVDYSSGGGVNTLLSINYLAGNLKEYIDTKYKNVPAVDIVAHSMGGLVARAYLKNGGSSNTEVRKLIMIGTPNNGSELITLVKDLNNTLTTTLEALCRLGGDTGAKISNFIDFMQTVDGPDYSVNQMEPNSAFLKSLGSNAFCPNQTYLISGANDTWGDCSFLGFPIGKTIESLVEPYLKGTDDGVVRSVSVDVGDIKSKSYNATHSFCDKLAEMHNPEIMQGVLDILKGKVFTTSSIEIPSLTNVTTNEPSKTQYLSSESGTLIPQGNKSLNIPIDVDAVTFLLTWTGGSIEDISLTSPSGEIVARSADEAEKQCVYIFDQINATGIQQYQLNNLLQGNWSLQLQSNSETPINFNLLVMANTGLSISLVPDKFTYKPGEAINFSCSLIDNGTPVTDADVKTKIESSDGAVKVVQMFDDGNHNDGASGNGIYGGQFTNTNLIGTYHITASGIGASESFHRVSPAMTIWITQYPDLAISTSDITFNNANPKTGEDIYIYASIHNLGNANATGVIIDFYDGDPAAGNLINETTIDAPAGGTGTCSVNWQTLSGDHEIFAVVSPYNVFLESDYANNQASQDISVSGISQLEVSGYPSSIYEGTSGNFSVVAKDEYGNIITDYGGTVHFTSSDNQAILPDDYTFLSIDSGMHNFSATLYTSGYQSIIVTDTNLNSIFGTKTNIMVCQNTSILTFTNITSSTNPSILGQQVSFTATANYDTQDTRIPTGTAVFYDFDSIIGFGVLNDSGQATLTTESLSEGSHYISAIYDGDSDFSGSKSPDLVQVVHKTSTITTLVSSPNPSSLGDTVTFTATIDAVFPGTGIPTGTVSFKDGLTEIGSGTLDAFGQAEFATSDLTVGDHDITAVYNGNEYFQGNTSSPVTQIVKITSLKIVTSSPLNNGQVKLAYSETLGAINGTLPYTWTISSGKLPKGLSLKKTTGVISGKPSKDDNSTFKVRVTDKKKQTDEQQYNITIYAAPRVVTTSLYGAVVGVEYGQKLAAEGGYGSYTWSKYSGSLPPGLNLDGETGVINGIVDTDVITKAKTYKAVFEVKDAMGGWAKSKSLSLKVTLPLSITNSSPLPSGDVGIKYSQPLKASGGSGKYCWSLAEGSNLPPALTISTKGVISGRVATASTSNFAVVVDDGDNRLEKEFTLTINDLPLITNTILPDGKLGQSYMNGINPVQLTAIYGDGKYSWTKSGVFPPGLTLGKATGIISGIPTKDGTYYFTVKVTDGLKAAATLNFTINIY